MSDTVDQVVEQPATERDDVAADVRAAVEQYRSKAADPAPDPVPDKPAADKPVDPEPKAAAEPPTEPEDKSSDRQRDERGRFASKAEEAAEPQTPADPKATDPEVAVAKATASWTPADREMLGKLDPEAQAFVLRRERERDADYTRKTQALASLRREYEPVEAMFKPHEAAMAARGMTRAGMIQAWGQAENTLVQGGQRAVDLLANIVQTYRVPLDQLADRLGIRPYAPQAGDPQPDHPQQQAYLPPELIQTIQQQNQQIQQLQQTYRQQEMVRQQTAEQAVISEIDQFATATDSAGALLHPHFHEVEAQMEIIAWGMRNRGEKVPTLSDLYDQAVYANPSTRAKLVAAERAADEAQRAVAEKRRLDEARAKAEKAKRAGSPISGAPGSVQSGRPADDSLRGSIMEAYRQHVGAV